MMLLVFSEHVFIPEIKALISGAVQKYFLRFFIHIAPSGVNGIPVFFQYRVNLTHSIGIEIFGNRRNNPLSKGQRLIRNDQLTVELHIASYSAALRTRAERTVKGKHTRRNFRKADAAVYAGKILAEHQGLSINHLNVYYPLSKLKRGFKGICQTLLHIRTYNKTVYYNLNGMLFIFVQLYFVIYVVCSSINADTHISLSSDTLQHLFVLTFFTAYNLCHYKKLGTLRERCNPVNHLVNGLLCNRLAAFRAVRSPCTGKKKTQIIIYLRYRTHSRTWITARCLLVYGYSR